MTINKIFINFVENSKYHIIKRPANHIIIKAIEKAGGLIKPTARALNVSRKSVYNWIEKDPELQEAKRQAEESMLDMAEGALYTNVQEGREASIFFLLKTKGKERGYVEREEKKITGSLEVKQITGMTIED